MYVDEEMQPKMAIFALKNQVYLTAFYTSMNHSNESKVEMFLLDEDIQESFVLKQQMNVKPPLFPGALQISATTSWQ